MLNLRGDLTSGENKEKKIIIITVRHSVVILHIIPANHYFCFLLLLCALLHLLQVGGLGDVVTSLSRAVQDLNHNVDIILPKYDCLKHGNVSFIDVACPYLHFTSLCWQFIFNSLNFGCFWLLFLVSWVNSW